MMGFSIAAVILFIFAVVTLRSRLEPIYNFYILTAGSAIAAYLAQSDATIQQIMRIVYPALSGLSVAVFSIMIYRHRFILRNRGILLTAFYFGLNFLVSGILSLVTGDHPVFDFEMLRPYLVSIRYLMVVLLVVTFLHQIEVCRTIFMSLYYDDEM